MHLAAIALGAVLLVGPSQVAWGSSPHLRHGYTWLDVDGRPLPFQDFEAIEKALLEGASGSLQIWMEGVSPESVLHESGGPDPPDITRWNRQKRLMLVFDNIVANR